MAYIYIYINKNVFLLRERYWIGPYIPYWLLPIGYLLFYFGMGCTTLWAPLLDTWTFVTATRALSNSDILQRDNSKANIITQEGAQEGTPQGNRQGDIK